MKKFICYFLAFVMIISSSLIAFADEGDIISIEAENYTEYYDTTNGNMYAPNAGGDSVDVKDGIIAFDKNEWLKYSITAPKAGMYALTVLAGTRNDSTVLTVSVMDKEVLSLNLSSTGNMNTFSELSVGNIPLAEGDNIIKFSVSERVFNFDSFKLTYVGEAMTMLEETNTIEAESADELTSETVDDATGEVVVFNQESEENYTLGAYSSGVYRVKASLKGEGTVRVSLNEKVIVTKNVKNSTYFNLDLGNVLFYEGKNILTVKVTGGSLNIDYFDISLFNPENEIIPEELTIPVESYARKEGNMSEGKDSSGKRYISFNAGRILEYDITLPKAGLYQFVVYSAIGPDYAVDEAELEVTVGEKSAKGKSYKTSNWYDYQPFTLCGMLLDAGDVTLKIKGAAGASHINCFVLKYLGNGISLDGVTANGEALATNSKIPRGTDRFTAVFSVEPDTDTITDENIILTSNGENIPLAFTTDGEKVHINLLKTLDFDAEITLTIKGIKDGTKESEAEATEYIFYTEGDFAGDGKIGDVTYSNDYEEIKINGCLYSGNGFKMEGRTVTMYIKHSDAENETLASSVYSQNNGEFEILYTLPEGSKDGIYEISLYAEYQTEPEIVKIAYMNRETERDMLSLFSDSESSEDVKNIFEENAQILGVDIESDLAPTEIADKDAFYAHFVGKSYSTKEEVKSDYEKYLLLEKINQAFNKDVVSEIIYSEEKAEKLGLSFDRIKYVVANKEQMTEDIYEMDAISDIKEFSEKCMNIIEKSLSKETDTHTSKILTENIETTKEGGVLIDLTLDSGYNEVKEAVFYINYKSGEFTAPKVSAYSSHKTSLEETENGIKVTITPKWSLGETKEFAKVYLTAPKTSGEYEIEAEGQIMCSKKYYPSESDEISTIDVIGFTEAKTVKVTVKASQSGSGQSSNSGKSHSSSSGGSSIRPTVVPTPMPTETPVDKPIESEEVFKDLDDVSWAKESIYNLLEKGIISKAEKFNPLNNIKREEFVKMLVIALGIYDETAQADFGDVAENAWYNSYVASAQKAGIVKGDDSGNFGSGNEITRQDMAVMIKRAAKLSAETSEDVFADDSDISDYAKDAVYIMRALGIINGVGDNNFAPKMPANRAQAAKIINGMLMMEVEK